MTWIKEKTTEGGINTVISESTINGNITVDGEEVEVYSDTEIRNILVAKANTAHTQALSSITDVDPTAKVNGYALIYDGVTGKFKSQPLPTGTGSGATNLDGLSDVDITTSPPVNGDTLVFNGGTWKPSSINGNGIKTGQEISYEFDIQNFSVSEEQTTMYLPVQTYNANSTAVVHPHVLYFENKWNGYHYWMGINPYASINFENPAIFVSQNGKDWFEPSGIINPIDGAPPSGGYGSDINLFMDKDGKTMHVLNRQVIEATGLRRIYIYSSTNGVNWTTRHAIIESTDFSTDFMSPSVLLEDDGTYRMWAVDFFRQLSPLFIRNEVVIYTATDARGIWAATKTITMPNIATDQRIWHLEVRKIANAYYMLYQTCHPTQHGGAGQMYFAKSFDGEVWESCQTSLSSLFDGFNNAAYKSSFLPVIDGGGLKFKVWYNYTGGSGKWWLGYVEVKNNSISKIDYNTTGKRLIFKDTFDDDTLSKWTLQNPTPCLNVVNGIADTVGASGTGKVYKLLPVNDYAINLTLEDITRENGFGAFFYVNSKLSNDWDGMMFGYESNKLILAIRKNATTIRKIYIRQVLQKGDVITFEVSYTNKYIKVFINGTIYTTYENLDNVLMPTNSRMGFFASTTIGSIGRLAVQEISVYAIDHKEPHTLASESQMKLLVGKGDDYKGDTFKKANGSVGTLLDGQAWVVGAGTFTIENNKLKSTTTAPSVLFVETGWVNYSAEIATNSRGGVVLRYVDSSNYLHVDYDGSSLRVRKTVAGTTSTLESFNFPITGIRIVTATVSNDRLTALVNGRVVYDDIITDSIFTSSTKVGVYTNGVDLINYFLVSKA